jgi:hypothetical protein
MYCTILTYSLAVITCDCHEELRISSVPRRSSDICGISSAKLSGPWQSVIMTVPQAPEISVHLFDHQCDLWQINQLFSSKGLVTCDRRVGRNGTVYWSQVFALLLHIIAKLLLLATNDTVRYKTNFAIIAYNTCHVFLMCPPFSMFSNNMIWPLGFFLQMK